jgi:hypothetical protein
MRTLIAAVMVALLTVAAHAQDGATMGKRQQASAPAAKKEDPAKKKAEEKAYKDALDKIPESKEKPDPWKSMR